jgi:predicted secreted protein
MAEQFDKAKYVEIVRRIRDEYSLSLGEIATDLDMTYVGVKNLLDPECSGQIRALTVRKIKGLMNKYKEEKE